MRLGCLSIILAFLSFLNSNYVVTALPYFASPPSLIRPFTPSLSIFQSAKNISLSLPTSGASTHLTYWPKFPYTVDLLYTDTRIIFIMDYGTGSITQKWEAERLFRDEILYLSTNPRHFHPFVLSVARSFTQVNLTCRSESSGLWTVDTAVEMLEALSSLVKRWGARDLDFEIWDDDKKNVICALRLENV